MHKAETKDRVKVVVKVQHEGIKDVILQVFSVSPSYDHRNALTVKSIDPQLRNAVKCTKGGD